MDDDPAILQKRVAYLDAYRALYRREQTIGLIACLVGALMLIGGRYGPLAASWVVWVGAAIIAAGWILFTVVIFRRTAWVRAHPFDPSGQI